MGDPEDLTFVGGGGARLSAEIRRPEGPARGSALLAHCFTCSKDLHTISRLSRSLAAAGWVTFSFDFTGLGSSDGEFASTSLSTNVRDLTAAAMAMIERRIGPCLLLGHSLGGTAAVLAAARIHSVDQVVCIASPADAAHVRALLPPDAGEDGTPFEVCVGGRPFVLDPAFLADLDAHDVAAAARSLDRPVLVVEAGADEVVGPEETRALAEAAGAELAVVEGADHLFTAPEHARQMADIVVEWASRRTAR